jgi:hypothetical protein
MVHAELHAFQQGGMVPQDRVKQRLLEHRKTMKSRKATRTKKEFKFFEYTPKQFARQRSGKLRGAGARSRSPNLSRPSSAASSRRSASSTPKPLEEGMLSQDPQLGNALQQQQQFLQLQHMYHNQLRRSPLTQSTLLARSAGAGRWAAGMACTLTWDRRSRAAGPCRQV